MFIHCVFFFIPLNLVIIFLRLILAQIREQLFYIMAPKSFQKNFGKEFGTLFDI